MPFVLMLCGLLNFCEELITGPEVNIEEYHNKIISQKHNAKEYNSMKIIN
jgi:hypothetical protein